MPKLHPDGTLSLSSTEVKDLRATIYGYGRDIARDRDTDAARKMQAIRTILLVMGEEEAKAEPVPFRRGGL